MDTLEIRKKKLLTLSDETFLSKFRCCVCYKVSTDHKVTVCENMHYTCHSCLRRQTRSRPRCPLCRASGPRIPCTVVQRKLKRVLKTVRLKCDNEGCTASLLSKDVENHTSLCSWQLSKCPASKSIHKCAFRGSIRELVNNHILMYNKPQEERWPVSLCAAIKTPISATNHVFSISLDPTMFHPISGGDPQTSYMTCKPAILVNPNPSHYPSTYSVELFKTITHDWLFYIRTLHSDVWDGKLIAELELSNKNMKKWGSTVAYRQVATSEATYSEMRTSRMVWQLSNAEVCQYLTYEEPRATLNVKLVSFAIYEKFKISKEN